MEKDYNKNPEHQNTSSIIKLPLIIAIALSVGMIIGGEILGPSRNDDNTVSQNTTKLEQVLNNISKYYVDSVDTDQLTEKAIKALIKELDPHTSYISNKDVEFVTSHLKDGFEGVGIEFRVFRDTIKIVGVTTNGPSAKAGILPGDKLIFVNGEDMTGEKVRSENILKKLRGVKGEKVSIGVKRKGEEETLYYTVTRDKIPTPAVSASYLIDENTGYIKIDRFGSNTYKEFKQGIDNLLEQGMEQLVLDLRDNGGGYMGQAVQVVDEFLPENKLIVYTDGKDNSFDEHEYSTSSGAFTTQPLIVLINEHSASASEIVTGALQDNDRALVVGRRSFGKGLVQRQIRLNDKSMLRLTISRYYTPSGRCIQKPYKNRSDYNKELSLRYENGEVFDMNNTQVPDSLQYTTVGGRIVFGGGGITPDVFIGMDTSYHTNYFDKLSHQDLIRDFAIDYANEHKPDFSEWTENKFFADFNVSKDIKIALIKYGQQNGVKYNKKEFRKSNYKIEQLFKSTVARVLWGDLLFFRVHNYYDPTLNETLTLFDKAVNLERIAQK